MAKMQSFGLDAVAVQLKELGQQTGPVAQRMLEAGAGELKALWRKEISARGHVDTGDMLESVDATEPKKSADGLMIEVHNDPARAKSDGAQSLTPDQFDDLMSTIRPELEFFGKTLN